jgi:phosphoribosylformylglycinamidine (FGAM) synthase PurS component
MKINCVYKYQNYYYFVSGVKKRKKRNVYILKKVNLDGSLGQVIQVYFKRGKFELVNDVKIKIFVEMKKSTKDQMAYDVLVARVKETFKQNTVDGKVLLTNSMLHDIAQNAVASIVFYNHEKGRLYNLRDFGKAIGLKNSKKIYSWVVKFYKQYFTKEKYSKAIKEASDTTISKQLKDYQKYWKCLHGFNKELNNLLEEDFKAYMEEFKHRGLSL